MICFADDPTPLQVRVLGTYLRSRYELHHDLQPGSVEQKRVAIGKFEAFLRRTATLDDLTRDQMAAFAVWFGRQAAPETVASKQRILVGLWSAAYDEGLLSTPPHKIRTVRVPTKVPEGLTLDELRQVTAAIEKLPGVFRCKAADGRQADVPRPVYFQAWLRCFLATGLRENAMTGVLMRDVRQDGTFVVRWKNQKTWAEQTKQLDEPAWEAVQAVQRLGPFERLLPGPSAKWIGIYWKVVLILAGFDPSRTTGPQMLRRIAASYKHVQQPGSAKKFLGHKTAGLAERRYLIPRITEPADVAGPGLKF